jgi:hypothetical protein
LSQQVSALIVTKHLNHGKLGSVMRIRGWGSWPAGVRRALAGLGVLVLLLVVTLGAGFGALLAEDSGSMRSPS